MNGCRAARGEHLQKTTRHFLCRLFYIAPNQRVGFDGFFCFQYTHGLRRRNAVLVQGREGGFSFSNASADVGQLRLRGLFVVARGSPGLDELAVLILQPLNVGRAELLLCLHRISQGKLNQSGGPAVLGRWNCPVVGFGAQKNSGQRVVIGHRDRIILVVVAAGARDGQSQHSLAHNIDLLVHQVHLELARIALVEPLGSHGQKARGNEMLLPLGIGLDLQHIPGDLFPDEFVVGFVCVEGIKDIIAVTPRVRVGDVDVLAG